MNNYTCDERNITSYNTSQFDFPGSKTKVFVNMDAYALSKIVLYLLMITFAVLGNIAVIIIVFSNKHMRLTTNYYLVNLAIADILIASGCMSVHLINNLAANSYIMGAFVCRTDGFVQSTSVTASVFTLVAISCDRFFAVMFPLRARITQRSASAVIISIWLMAIIISLPFIIFRHYRIIEWRDHTTAACGEIWPVQYYYHEESGKCLIDHYGQRLYYTICSIAWFFFPVAIMTATYTSLVLKLWFSRNSGSMGNIASTIHDRAKKKVIKMVIIVLAAFIICWMPLQIFILYSAHTYSDHLGGLPAWFRNGKFFVYFIAYCNSALNPVIYCGFNGNYRQGLLVLLRCASNKRNSTSTRTKQSVLGPASSRTRETTKTTHGYQNDFSYHDYMEVPMRELKGVPTSKRVHL